MSKKKLLYQMSDEEILDELNKNLNGLSKKKKYHIRNIIMHIAEREKNA